MGAALSNLRQFPAQSAAHCAHCGSPSDYVSTSSDNGPAFCCNGCRFVYRLIQEQGLAKFYDLREGIQPPVQSSVFQRHNFEWLVPLCCGRDGRVELELQGMSCLACVWLIQRVFEGFPGAQEIRVDLLLGTADLKVSPEVFPGIQFAESLQRLGYRVGPRTGGHHSSSGRALLVRMGVCGALAMNSMLFAVPVYCGLEASDRLTQIFARGAFVCASASMVVGATHFLGRAFQSARKGIVHMDLPISLGLLAAYGGSVAAWISGDGRGLYFDFVSIFTFLMLVGRWVHQSAVARNRRRLLQAPLALLRPAVGERYAVAAGLAIPVRSLLLSDAADLGLEWINGEPEARCAHTGSAVPSGAINLSNGSLQLEALENWEDSLLSQLLAAPVVHPEQDSAIQRFIVGYLCVVLLLAFGGFCTWWLAGQPLQVAFQVLVSVLVVSCPCASGVALPLVTELVTAQMRDCGVFVREPGVWTRLLRTRRLVFDKTGTLTSDCPRLRSRTELETLAPGALMALRHLVGRSMHPVATSLREALGQAVASEGESADEASEFAGLGLEWQDSQQERWRLGRAEWALERLPMPDVAAKTVLSCNGLAVAGFEFEETLRPDAAHELEALRQAHFEVQILSGDHPAQVAKVAQKLGLPVANASGGLTPSAKAEWLKAHGACFDTLMLGDGANDALAFSESLCCGTPAVDRGVLEQRADFYYLGRGLAGVRLLIEAAFFKRRVSRAVLAFTGAYNVVAIGLALGGKMHPLLAAILMPISSLATIALVFFLFKKSAAKKPLFPLSK